jgi:hypothetical protein
LTALQEYKIESGEPSGKLKIGGVPELPEMESAKATEKESN